MKTVNDILRSHRSLFDVVIDALKHHVCIIAENLPKCEAKNCDRPMTVVNHKLGKKRCDRCCAEAIHAAKMTAQLLSDGTVPPGHGEMAWIDVPNASAIRQTWIHYMNSRCHNDTVH
jgi:hypothetical protein